jgi:hypothetical protein
VWEWRESQFSCFSNSTRGKWPPCWPVCINTCENYQLTPKLVKENEFSRREEANIIQQGSQVTCSVDFFFLPLFCLKW